MTALSLTLALFALSQSQAPSDPQAPPATFYWGDYDADGLRDALVLPRGDEPRLLANRGDGTLADVTATSGLELEGALYALWEDVDGDGHLDLYVGGSARLYLGTGDGVFAEVRATGFEHRGDLRAGFLDYDEDGRPDLHVRVADGERLYRNLGLGAFESVQAVSTLVGSAPASTPEGVAEARDSMPAAGEARTRDRDGRRPVTAGGAGTQAAGGPTGNVSPAPYGGTPAAASAVPKCPNAIKDIATNSCTQVSSIPTLGMLLPLSSDLFVDTSGYVGVGTASPGERLEVAGNLTFSSDDEGLVFPVSGDPTRPMISMFGSGSVNADRMVLGHSPAYANWGLHYEDFGDRFSFRAGGGEIFSVDLGSRAVGVESGAPLVMRDSGGTSTLFMDGDGVGGGGLAEVRGDLGESAVRLIGEPTSGGGVVETYDDAGTKLTTELGSTFNGGRLRLHDFGSDLRYEVDAGGSTTAWQTNGKLSYDFQWNTGGDLRMYDGGGEETINLDGGGATIRTSNFVGQTMTSLGTSTAKGGHLSLFDDFPSLRVSVEADSNLGGGALRIHDESGGNKVALRGGNSIDSAYLHLWDRSGYRTFEANTDTAKGGEVQVNNLNGFRGVTVWGGNTTSGGTVAVSRPNGAYALVLEGESASGDPRVGIGTGAPQSHLHLQDTDSVELRLVADLNNFGEDEHPSILFSQDGFQVETRVGFVETGNAFTIESYWDDDMHFDLPAGGTGDWEFRNQANGTVGDVEVRLTDTGNIELDGSIFSPAADLAEYYPVEGPIEPGDVVAFTGDGLTLARAALGDGRALAGVVSSAPALVMGLSYTDETQSDTRAELADGERFIGTDPERRVDRLVVHEIEVNSRAPLALAGRVPCKVNLEGGSIRAGDLLTVSSVSGVACKATGPGAVIGTALESHATGAGTIVVFANLGEFSPVAAEGQRAVEGRAALQGGFARVTFPAGFSPPDPDDVVLQLTSLGSRRDLWVRSIDAFGFEVEGTGSDGTFFWAARALR
jgi:hypothetical protein